MAAMLSLSTSMRCPKRALQLKSVLLRLPRSACDRASRAGAIWGERVACAKSAVLFLRYQRASYQLSSQWRASCSVHSILGTVLRPGIGTKN